ncbi:MAG: hypothetical protein WC365_08370 [Candidatus Babeliales bacterium]|jgi:hypothetical protein
MTKPKNINQIRTTQTLCYECIKQNKTVQATHQITETSKIYTVCPHHAKEIKLKEQPNTTIKKLTKEMIIQTSTHSIWYKTNEELKLLSNSF